MTTTNKIGEIIAACIFAYGARPTDKEYMTFKRMLYVGRITVEQETIGL